MTIRRVKLHGCIEIHHRVLCDSSCLWWRRARFHLLAHFLERPLERTETREHPAPLGLTRRQHAQNRPEHPLAPPPHVLPSFVRADEWFRSDGCSARGSRLCVACAHDGFGRREASQPLGTELDESEACAFCAQPLARSLRCRMKKASLTRFSPWKASTSPTQTLVSSFRRRSRCSLPSPLLQRSQFGRCRKISLSCLLNSGWWGVWKPIAGSTSPRPSPLIPLRFDGAIDISSRIPANGPSLLCSRSGVHCSAGASNKWRFCVLSRGAPKTSPGL